MDFKLPELGEGVYEAELVAWLVKPGDPVKRGQNLMEVLTDKATMEVPSPFAGTIDELKAKRCSTVFAPRRSTYVSGRESQGGAGGAHVHGGSSERRQRDSRICRPDQ